MIVSGVVDAVTEKLTSCVQGRPNNAHESFHSPSFYTVCGSLTAATTLRNPPSAHLCRVRDDGALLLTIIPARRRQIFRRVTCFIPLLYLCLNCFLYFLTGGAYNYLGRNWFANPDHPASPHWGSDRLRGEYHAVMWRTDVGCLRFNMGGMGISGTSAGRL